MRPLFSTAMRSATSSASSWSWVTSTVVTWTSSCRRRSHCAQLGADLGVQRAERLVEQQHLRLDRERAGERHPLALAAGELRRVALLEARRGRRSRAARRPRASISRLGPLADRQAEGDVVAHGHVLERGVVLEDEADAALLRRHAGDVVPADRRPRPESGVSSPAMMRSSVDLPEPLGPEQRGERPVGDLERDVVEGDEVAVALAARSMTVIMRLLLLRSSRVISSRVTSGEAHEHGGGGVGAEGVVVVDVAGVDEQGQRLRLAGDAAGDHDHGAELAERAGDGEHDAVGRGPSGSPAA